MKKIALLLLMGTAMLSCRKDREKSDCNKMCTLDYRSVGIRFVDKNGAPTEVTGFSVVNQRTGEKVYASSAATINMIKGGFLVADDGNLRNLSEAGDNLKVTGTSVETNQTKSAVLKISGGKCACHIAKLSGPDQIAFD
ncbi:hypothetical protein [Pedobacter frigoris]|uniref:Lipoprotein n=1 Tax=Pedobacter frigoris TaxID=2571272 RepID=A0A4U1CG28_9SPHI|nr:hypothetical protein [Pedobacter frigoris]TKC03934.1 hypothetical protein FA047_18460 [Pedobacter frigoris]